MAVLCTIRGLNFDRYRTFPTKPMRNSCKTDFSAYVFVSSSKLCKPLALPANFREPEKQNHTDKIKSASVVCDISSVLFFHCFSRNGSRRIKEVVCDISSVASFLFVFFSKNVSHQRNFHYLNELSWIRKSRKEMICIISITLI